MYISFWARQSKHKHTPDSSGSDYVKASRRRSGWTYSGCNPDWPCLWSACERLRAILEKAEFPSGSLHVPAGTGMVAFEDVGGQGLDRAKMIDGPTHEFAYFREMGRLQ